jgi:hypothetical protein
VGYRVARYRWVMSRVHRPSLLSRHVVGQRERLCFGIPGGLCEDCHQLYIDPELIELLDLGEGRCVFAIESDVVLQEEAWSSAD